MTQLRNTLVVIAMPEEADGVFEAAGIPVLYCGVGKINAAMTLSRELSRYTYEKQAMPLVVNFGSAGSSRLATGSVVQCYEFLQRDMDVSALGFKVGVTPYESDPARISFAPVFGHLPPALCGSGDSFAVTPTSIACDVVDMEAYALAKVCRRAGARFACAKYVSDGADHQAATDWQDNRHRAAADFLALFRSLGNTG